MTFLSTVGNENCTKRDPNVVNNLRKTIVNDKHPNQELSNVANRLFLFANRTLSVMTLTFYSDFMSLYNRVCVVQPA